MANGCPDSVDVALVRRYRDEGFVFVGKLFERDEMVHIEATLMDIVNNRPPDLAPEDLLNLHMTNQAVYELAAHPRAVAVAKKLLGTADVSIFTTRVLCKQPRTGRALPWHQDSNYWPLVPPGGPADTPDPQVASLWLAVDGVGPDNGPMQVLPFSAHPASRGKNVEPVDAGGDVKGFSNFNLSVDVDKAAAARAIDVHIGRGEATFHSAFTLHRSDPNTGTRRRCAWIVRYVPTGTTVIGGSRDTFPSDYPFVPVSGKGAARRCPTPTPGAAMYGPCFGANKASKV